MKNIKNLMAVICLLTVVIAIGQTTETTAKIVTKKFKVEGVCIMCKERIESAAMIKGVRVVTWEKDTRILTVTYSTKKTTEDAIHKALAEAGHDTDKVKASDENYGKLPGCCKYRDGVETH